MPSKKTVAITGGTGFVGANLAIKLVREGHDVHLLVRPGYSDWRIQEIKTQAHIREVNLLEPGECTTALSDIKADWVFHLAANGAYSWQTDLDEIVQTNFLGTINLVRAAMQADCEAFVNTGSSSEYGFKDHAPAEDELPEPNSYYAAAKASATLFCRFMAQQNKKTIPTLRLYSVYGAYEDSNRLMPTIIMNGLQGKLPPLVDPNIARDYIYIDDVVDAYIAAATVDLSDPGMVLNVGSGVQTTLKEVVDVAIETMDIKEQPNWGSMPNRSWDSSVWVSNNEKIKTELKWMPKHSFAEGFAKFVQWFESNPEIAGMYENKTLTSAKK